jgi:hypothetical protein
MASFLRICDKLYWAIAPQSSHVPTKDKLLNQIFLESFSSLTSLKTRGPLIRVNAKLLNVPQGTEHTRARIVSLPCLLVGDRLGFEVR